MEVIQRAMMSPLDTIVKKMRKRISGMIRKKMGSKVKEMKQRKGNGKRLQVFFNS